MLKNRRKEKMSVDSDTIYKLMILYMLNKLDCQLTNSQLQQFFTTKGYTDYFNFQQSLSELVDANFADKVVIRNTSYYSITSDGYETLTYFKNKIPKGALDDINDYLETNRYALKNEVGTVADYYKHTSGDYIAHLVVNEGKTLLYELDISVPSEDEAKRICDNWRIASEEIYGFIVKSLLQ